MDGNVGPPEEGGERDRGGPDRSTASSRLVERLTELRTQLAMLTPDDRRREAVEAIGQARERISALEEMLAWAREREDELTARAVRDRMRISELESSIVELRAAAARASEAEAALARAETDSAEWQQLVALAQTELEAKHDEVGRLTARVAELEVDLRSLANEVGDAAVARAEAERLERERNVARERARTERRLALEDRLRAAEAEGRAAELQRMLLDAEARLKELLSEAVASGMLTEGEATDVEAAYEPAYGEAVTVERQATWVIEEAEPVHEETREELEEELDVDEEELEAEEDERAEVIDLTGESRSSGRRTGTDEEAEQDDVIVWTSPHRPTILDRLRRGLTGEDADDDRDVD